MFTLEREKSKFYRVKRGQSENQVGAYLQAPVPAVFAGAIVPADCEYLVYGAKPLDTFATVAKKFKVDERVLEELNFGGAVYPTRKIYIPRA